MASRPSTKPRFADDGSAAVTEPGSTKKDTGWLVAERPAAQYMNWLHRTVYDWIVYFDEGPGTLLLSAHDFNSPNGSAAIVRGGIGGLDDEFATDGATGIGAAWLPTSGTPGVNLTGIVLAPFRIPVGMKITAVDLYFQDNSSAHAFNAWCHRLTPDATDHVLTYPVFNTANAENRFDGTVANSAGAKQVFSPALQANSNVIASTGVSFNLVMEWEATAGAAALFRGAKVTYGP